MTAKAAARGAMGRRDLNSGAFAALPDAGGGRGFVPIWWPTARE